MTLSDLKNSISNNPNPIFDEEIEFTEFVELIAIRNKKIEFNKKTVFSYGAIFQGVDLTFYGAVFHESLEIENVSKIQFVNCSFNNIKVSDCQNLFLSFKDCEINSIYFEESDLSENLIFDNTNILKFISKESKFTHLEFNSKSENSQIIGHLEITGKSISSLIFNNIGVGYSRGKKNFSTCDLIIHNCNVELLYFDKCNFYNSVVLHNQIKHIIFTNRPKFNYIYLYGAIQIVDFNNYVIVNEIHIIGKINFVTISETSKINKCIFEESEIIDFSISGGKIGSILFQKQNIKNKFLISGGKIDEITIASNLNSILEVGSENNSNLKYNRKIHIGVFNLFEFSEVTFNDLYKAVHVNEMNFVGFVFPKDKNSHFSGFKLDILSFIDFYNYGNISFSNLNGGNQKSGSLQIGNSDLGKMLFMNCDFSDYKMHFVSSKITEIFLAGTTMPASNNINNEKDFEDIHNGNKRLAFTQLKKVYDNRGDSFNATSYNEAELNDWYYEIENSDLEKRKTLFSLFKKMYEGRGDTVKAIEYQGKELDVHREILRKAGGQYWERFQLSLNKYSNNFGRSWHWTMGWILAIGILFYILYCLSIGFRPSNSSVEDKQRFWTLTSYFFEFINPIRKGEFIKLDGDNYYPISGWARVIDFFWRIVITYLGYQLIQAFRKYSKKTS